LIETVDARTDFAWQSRYPGELYVVAEREAEALLALVERVLAEIQARSPEEAQFCV
jgi:hypothetical protein